MKFNVLRFKKFNIDFIVKRYCDTAVLTYKTCFLPYIYIKRLLCFSANSYYLLFIIIPFFFPLILKVWSSKVQQTIKITYPHYVSPERTDLPYRFYSVALYHNEAYPFALRINAQSAYVHKFLLICSNRSFQGNGIEQANFHPFEDIVHELGDRLVIRYYFDEVEITPYDQSREKLHRNSATQFLAELHPRDQDIIFFSDIDEIAFSDAFEDVLLDPPSTVRFYTAISTQYTTRWVFDEFWYQPFFANYGWLTKKCPIPINTLFQIYNWKNIHDHDYPVRDLPHTRHFSNFFNSISQLQNKLASTSSNKKYNIYPINDTTRLFIYAACGKDYITGKKGKLIPPIDTKFAPILNDIRMIKFNSKIAFDNLDGVDIRKFKIFKACSDAYQYYQALVQQNAIHIR